MFAALQNGTMRRNVASAVGVAVVDVAAPSQPYRGCIETTVQIDGLQAVVRRYDSRWDCQRWAVVIDGSALPFNGDRIATVIADIRTARGVA